MTRSNFLADLLSSVFERGQRRFVSGDRRSIEALCKALLSESGESSGTRLAGAILDRYAELDQEGRKRFFSLLVDEYDIDTDKVAAAANSYGDSRDSADLATLLEEAEPKRQELLRRINRAPGAMPAMAAAVTGANCTMPTSMPASASATAASVRH